MEAWWAHMQAHQIKFQYKRSKHRPMKNFMMRIEKTGRTSAAGTNIANSQYVVSLHRDSKSGIIHMHLDCNRIDMDGNVNDDHNIGIS